jgi:hypothetical protein
MDQEEWDVALRSEPIGSDQQVEERQPQSHRGRGAK